MSFTEGGSLPPALPAPAAHAVFRGQRSNGLEVAERGDIKGDLQLNILLMSLLNLRVSVIQTTIVGK